MSHSELPVALENIIIDEVATVPTPINRKIDTSAPLEVGIAAKDGESVREEENPRIVDLALHAFFKGIGKDKRTFGNGQSWNEKGGKGGKDEGRNPWQ